MSDVRGNQRAQASVLKELNDPSAAFRDPRQTYFIRVLVSAISDLFRSSLRNDRAEPYVMLEAPDNGTWRVTVANDGSLTTQRVDRAER